VASDDLTCDAGNRAFWGGHWDAPCQQRATDLIAVIGMRGYIQLCKPHFTEVLGAGLVDEPNLPKGEFLQRFYKDNPDA
jgi:hypothetical protein